MFWGEWAYYKTSSDFYLLFLRQRARRSAWSSTPWLTSAWPSSCPSTSAGSSRCSSCASCRSSLCRAASRLRCWQGSRRRTRRPWRQPDRSDFVVFCSTTPPKPDYSSASCSSNEWQVKSIILIILLNLKVEGDTGWQQVQTALRRVYFRLQVSASFFLHN